MELLKFEGILCYDLFFIINIKPDRYMRSNKAHCMIPTVTHIVVKSIYAISQIHNNATMHIKHFTIRTNEKKWCIFGDLKLDAIQF